MKTYKFRVAVKQSEISKAQAEHQDERDEEMSFIESAVTTHISVLGPIILTSSGPRSVTGKLPELYVLTHGGCVAALTARRNSALISPPVRQAAESASRQAIDEPYSQTATADSNVVAPLAASPSPPQPPPPPPTPRPPRGASQRSSEAGSSAPTSTSAGTSRSSLHARRLLDAVHAEALASRRQGRASAGSAAAGSGRRDAAALDSSSAGDRAATSRCSGGASEATTTSADDISVADESMSSTLAAFGAVSR